MTILLLLARVLIGVALHLSPQSGHPPLKVEWEVRTDPTIVGSTCVKGVNTRTGDELLSCWADKPPLKSGTWTLNSPGLWTIRATVGPYSSTPIMVRVGGDDDDPSNP